MWGSQFKRKEFQDSRASLNQAWALRDSTGGVPSTHMILIRRDWEHCPGERSFQAVLSQSHLGILKDADVWPPLPCGFNMGYGTQEF